MTRRRSRPASEIQAASTDISRRVLDLVELRDAHTVAVYVSMGLEPGTEGLLGALLSKGLRVLLPVRLPDNDLDWVIYGGPPSVFRSGHGTAEIVGDRLGVDAIADADLVVCPALAADRHGNRLGRGGGSYDRALSRVRPDAVRCVLVFADEVFDEVPREAHDQKVDVVITPTTSLEIS